VFTIAPLSDTRQRELVKRNLLPVAAQSRLLEGLSTGPSDIRLMSSNPMFLGLLCEHVKRSSEFPASVHAVFDDYVRGRMTDDRDRLRQRYSVDIEELRKFAEAVAFAMASDK